ncbi:unnamed protein product [Schistosoma rodhaini]|nr:unnamed protein product [Schistosoma rodhaini]
MKVLSAGYRSRKTDKIQDPVESWGTCCLVLQTGHLFRINPPGWIVASKPLTQTTNISLNKPPLSSVTLELENNFKDILVGMKLSNPLMSDHQRQKFQPIILTIDRLHNLPVAPYRSYEEMRNICEPLRLVTTFSDVWSHQSREYVQEKEIYMDEVQVILTYDIPGLYLRELVQTLPVVIDLYDRVCHDDGTTEVKQLPGNGLFCTEPDDDKIGKAQPNLKTNIFSTKCIDKNTGENRSKLPSPTGRIVLDLSEIIHLKCVKMKRTLPILPISESDLDLLKDHRSINENPRSIPRSYIGYMDCQCEISIEIEMNINMDRLLQINALPENAQTIERMVFILEKPDKTEIEAKYVSEIIEKIQLFVLKSNARSIGISDELPLHIIKANLNSRQSQYMPCIHSKSSNTILLNNSNDKHNNENIQLVNKLITGFYLNDEDFNLIILETDHHDISQSLESLFIECFNKYNEYSKLYSIHKYNNNNNNVKFLKNNKILFTKRLYASLNWYLLEYKMLIPIKSIINQSIFYIRDLLPRLIYCFIYKIINLRFYCFNLSNCIKENLLPNYKMIQLLIKQFCISSILINNNFNLLIKSSINNRIINNEMNIEQINEYNNNNSSSIFNQKQKENLNKINKKNQQKITNDNL